MNRLLKFETRRLFRAKYFYVCIAIAFALVLISAATTKLLLNALKDATPEFPDGFDVAMLQAPTALSLLKGVLSSSFTLILAVFVSLFVTEDYAGDIIKNVYGRGYTSNGVYFSKYLISLAGCLTFFLVDAILSFLSGAILFDGIGKMGTNYVGSILALALCVVAYHALYFAISISLRKTGGSIALCIFAPLLIDLLLTLANAAIKSKKIDLTDYWLSGRVALLSQENVSNKDMAIGFAVAAAVIAVGILVSYFLNRKRDQ